MNGQARSDSPSLLRRGQGWWELPGPLPGERVSRGGAFTSRRVTGEGYLDIAQPLSFAPRQPYTTWRGK